MDDTTERAIGAGLRRGEATAWHALYAAHAESVWRMIARLIGPSAADVADVFQETFLAAARAARGYDSARGSLGQWLGGIARRQVALHFRRRELLARHESAAARSAVTPTDEPAEAAAAAELAGFVRGTLRELPEDYEALLTERYLDAIPVEQMARQRRCTAEAIRSKLARAREAFRRAFAHRHPAAVTDTTQGSP